MNANTIFNRFEIVFYSTLTSAMSGVTHLRTSIRDSSTAHRQQVLHAETAIIQQNDQPKLSSFALSWESFKAALLALFMWIVLGFAAGFLIGLLSPR